MHQRIRILASKGFPLFALVLTFFLILTPSVNATFMNGVRPVVWLNFDECVPGSKYYNASSPYQPYNWSFLASGETNQCSSAGKFGKAYNVTHASDILKYTYDGISLLQFGDNPPEGIMMAGWIKPNPGLENITNYGTLVHTGGGSRISFASIGGTGGVWRMNLSYLASGNAISSTRYPLGTPPLNTSTWQFFAVWKGTGVGKVYGFFWNGVSWINATGGTTTSFINTNGTFELFDDSSTAGFNVSLAAFDNIMLFNLSDTLNWSMARYLKDNCDGSGTCVGLTAMPGPKVIINPSVNSTTYNLTVNITANGTNLTVMHINATGLESPHNNNLVINLSKYNVSRVQNITNYTFEVFIGAAGYGNFSISVFNATDQVGGSKSFKINISVPTIIKIQDQVTSTDLGNINFTYTNRNITNKSSLGDIITQTGITNSSGEVTVNLYRFGDFTSITLTTTGISGYFDGSKVAALTQSANQRIVFSLEPIGGAGQVVLVWLDNLNYQPIEGIKINTSAHGSGVTGTWGKISFVGTVGETLTGIATKKGYINKTFNLEIFTRTETIYFIREGTRFNESIEVWVEPQDLRIDNSTPEFLFVNVKNWQSLKNLTVVIAKNNEIANLYDRFGMNSSSLGGDITVYNFFFNDTTWCNSSTLCTGDSSNIRFRPVGIPLRDFGGHVVLLINYYDTSEFKREYRRGGIFISPDNEVTNFFKNFSPEQLAWLGMFFLLAGTVLISVRLQLTFFQAGVVAFGIIILNITFEMWSLKVGVFPGVASALMMFKGATT